MEWINTKHRLPIPYKTVIGKTSDWEGLTYMYPNRTWAYNMKIEYWRYE